MRFITLKIHGHKQKKYVAAYMDNIFSIQRIAKSGSKQDLGNNGASELFSKKLNHIIKNF